MKQQLLKLTLLFLCLAGGISAWAENTVTVETGGTTTEYVTLKAAIEANVLSNDADVTITLSADQSLGDKVLSWEKGHTLTVKATKAVTIKGPNGSRWFTAKTDNCKFIIGDGNNEITLDGEYDGTASSKQRTQPVALHNNTKASITFNKVTFKNFNLNNAVNMIVGEAGDGDITLQNVTIENCVNPKEAYIDNLRVTNDRVVLKGYLNVDEKSTGTTIRTALETKYNSSESKYTTAGRIKVDDNDAALTATKTITVTFTEKSTTYVPQIGAAIVVNTKSNFTDATAAVFALANDVAYGTYRKDKDLKLTQAYNLEVGDATASTLILPFDATIPAGVKAYTLRYTTGSESVNATSVSTPTLGKDTPVLINAEKGTYKFVSTATSDALATGSGSKTSGALTGVYAETTPGTGHYILTNKDGKVGFRKTVAESKVPAYRCYLTAESGAHELSIIYDDNVTGIRNLTPALSEGEGVYYNLKGQRVANPTKGIFIVNGKKILMK